jgi:hypothetical protein
MDPDRALGQFRDAIRARDLDTAMELGEGLTTWVRSRGFLPAGCRSAGAVLSEVRCGIAQLCNVRGVLQPSAHPIASR